MEIPDRMREIIAETRQKARKAAENFLDSEYGLIADNLFKRIQNPTVYLRMFPWEKIIPVDADISQEDFSDLNENFDPRGCVGRITLAMYLLEKYFPDEEYQVGEVVSDDLASRMQRAIKFESDPKKRFEMGNELLMYEEPHAILVLENTQFDPLVRFIQDINHPKVKVYDQDPWEIITAFDMTNQALKEEHFVARDILLQLPDLFWPTRHIAQSRLACKVGFGDATVEDFEKFLADGHNARVEYQMWKIHGDERIFNNYPREVVEILNEEMASKTTSMSTGGHADG